MSKFLLKTLHQKYPTQTTTISESYERHLTKNNISNHHDQDNQGTLFGLRQQSNLLNEEKQMPNFYNKMKEMINQIQVIEGSFQQIHQHSYNEKKSQVQQVIYTAEEQLPPMILSIINNPRPGVNKLKYLHLRNSLSEIREVQFELITYLEDEKRLINDFHQKLCLAIENFCSQYRKKIENNRYQAEINQLKGQNSKLRQIIDKKQTKYQEISLELQSTRTSLQLQRRKVEKLELDQCKQCKQIFIKFQTFKVQSQKKQKEITKLKIQNQQLQEYIFGIQQKIVGIDLQVQRKLKDKVLFLDQYRNSPKQKEIQQLRFQLEKQNRQLKQIGQKHGQLNQRSFQIQQKERDIKNYELRVLEKEINLQHMQEKNYQRESQILQAEQNLLNKINEIKKKQKELSAWQVQLNQKANQLIRNAPVQTSQMRFSRQMSLKSFGRQPIVEIDEKISQRVKTQQNQSQFNGFCKPTVQKNQARFINPKLIMAANTQIKKDLKINKFYKTQINTSFYNQKIENMPYNFNISQKSIVVQNSKVGYNNSYSIGLNKNEKYKMSRSSRSIYNTGYGNQKTRIDRDASYFGLGQKLQRLREQLKKQIQAIK